MRLAAAQRCLGIWRPLTLRTKPGESRELNRGLQAMYRLGLALRKTGQLSEARAVLKVSYLTWSPDGCLVAWHAVSLCV